MKRRRRKDRITKAARSALMGKITSKNTDFERAVFLALRTKGIRFRTHYKNAFGNPDIAKPARRKAVFLHSDFWHGWRFPKWEEALPTEFWKEKIRRNRNRDQKVIRTLRRQGWKVLVIWEHQIKNDRLAAVDKITSFLAE